MRSYKEIWLTRWRRIRGNKRLLFKGKMILLFIGGFLLLLAIPTVLVGFGSNVALVAGQAIQEKETNPGAQKAQITDAKRAITNTYNPNVRVYLSKEKKVISLPLETYLEGVVAAEMPITFEIEALKAQAMAARTFVVNRLEKGSTVNLKSYGLPHQLADVTDTVQHQAYSTDDKLKNQWKDRYHEYKAKIKWAIAETRGQILTYQGQPIYAAFFSTSNGRTESSDEYFTAKYPYLVSVDSSWDRSSPKFEKEATYPISEVFSKLEKQTKKSLDVPVSLFQSGNQMRIVKKTTGNRIASLSIGDKSFSGREVREALGLASTDFTWKQEGDKITFTTYGYGHGVGLSQWGANLMAQTGAKADKIVKHYYQGIQISEFERK
ncbi:stage II sporulation protein D [Thermoactinomyces sp. DSM 45891]|uniref:stage II sporulation protein D n=1 Tax=Thermoactinomyces sp. DSM 45891 TaxID=1761907 RepID=UPI000923135D|nr:stage II sporulation protein D [Thermoactinomyces sp. DSM 45891]SFX23832.1 stage II sporulation protein D [Thermoactinomyces sp. DSM 45891]